MVDRAEFVAFAIYRTFSQEADPRRAEVRWARLPPLIRARFIGEAQAAIEALELFEKEMSHENHQPRSRKHQAARRR